MCLVSIQGCFKISECLILKKRVSDSKIKIRLRLECLILRLKGWFKISECLIKITKINKIKGMFQDFRVSDSKIRVSDSKIRVSDSKISDSKIHAMTLFLRPHASDCEKTKIYKEVLYEKSDIFCSVF